MYINLKLNNFEVEIHILHKSYPSVCHADALDRSKVLILRQKGKS